MMSQLKSLSGTRYSWQNCLLLLMQNPDATYIAGFHDWKKVGRTVKKGEKGLAIRAPFTKKLDEVDDNGNNKRITYFNLVYVFDISQTEGEEIPEIVVPLQGDDAGLYEALYRSAELNSMPVYQEALEHCNGYCKFNKAGDKVERIVVANHLSQLHKCKTLAHELAHALMHKGVDYAAHRPQCEQEAESVAFIVLSHFGLDSGDYSFGYVASWSGENAIANLKESASSIQNTASQIINWILDSHL
jgi:antirestriction protein ArdC